MWDNRANQHHERHPHNLHCASDPTGAGRNDHTHRHFSGGHDEIRFCNHHHRTKCQHFSLAFDGECRRGRDSGVYCNGYRNEQYERHLDPDAGWCVVHTGMRDDCTDEHGQWRTGNVHGANNVAG